MSGLYLNCPIKFVDSKWKIKWATSTLLFVRQERSCCSFLLKIECDNVFHNYENKKYDKHSLHKFKKERNSTELGQNLEEKHAHT